MGNRWLYGDFVEICRPPVTTFTKLICLVDDDVSVLRAMKRLLLSAGLTALTFSSPQEFIEYAKSNRVPVLILDVNMPELSGPEVFAWLRLHRPDARVIFISGTNNVSCCAAVMAQGAAAFFAKPFIDEVFLTCVHAELAKSS